MVAESSKFDVRLCKLLGLVERVNKIDSENNWEQTTCIQPLSYNLPINLEKIANKTCKRIF